MFHRNMSFVFLGVQHFHCCKNNELVILWLQMEEFQDWSWKATAKKKGGKEGRKSGCIFLRCEKIMFSHSLCKNNFTSKGVENILFSLGSEACYRKHEDSCSYILENKCFTYYDNLSDSFQNKVNLIKNNIKTTTPQNSWKKSSNSWLNNAWLIPTK